MNDEREFGPVILDADESEPIELEEVEDNEEPTDEAENEHLETPPDEREYLGVTFEEGEE